MEGLLCKAAETDVCCWYCLVNSCHAGCDMQEADVHKDAELVAGTAAHLMEQEQLKLRTSVMNRAILAKEKRLAALQSAVGNEGGLKTQYDKVLQQLQTERDTLQKERSSLVQVISRLGACRVECRFCCGLASDHTCCNLIHTAVSACCMQTSLVMIHTLSL